MLNNFQAFAKSATSKFVSEVFDVAGVRSRSRVYVDSVVIENTLQHDVKLSFHGTAISQKLGHIHTEIVPPRGRFTFEPKESYAKDFDFIMRVNDGEARCLVVRGGSYCLKANQDAKTPGAAGRVVVEKTLPLRQKSDRLSNIPGLTFSFSAAGWLFMYQLGVAECLQCNGVCASPYVRVAGSSGGALTVAAMMYGADMRALAELIKADAGKVHNDVPNAFRLRNFVLDACKTFVKDGSFQHQAFQEGRVEIAVSEKTTEVGQGIRSNLKAVMKGTLVQGRRCKTFGSSSDVVLALLASSSMGISGLPFTYKNEEGKLVKVADGGICDFLPVIDEFSIKVKPFSDGLNILGVAPDIAPTEFIPGCYGLYPPDLATLEHLYELGFQDTEMWMEQLLEQRVQRLSNKHGANTLRPLSTFACPNNGMVWLRDVMAKVPLAWQDQVSQNQFRKREPLREEDVDMEVRRVSTDDQRRHDGASMDEGRGMHRVVLFESHLDWFPLHVPEPVVVPKNTFSLSALCGLSKKKRQAPKPDVGREVTDPALLNHGTLAVAWVQDVWANSRCVRIETTVGMEVLLYPKNAAAIDEWRKAIESARVGARINNSAEKDPKADVGHVLQNLKLS